MRVGHNNYHSEVKEGLMATDLRVYDLHSLPDTVNFDAFMELRRLKQWVCWRKGEKGKNGKPEKQPFDPTTDYPCNALDPSNHSSFETAMSFLDRTGPGGGISFVPTEYDPFCFIDIDDCIDSETGEYTKHWVPRLVKKMNSLTYLTPSGKGIRIVLKAKLEGAGGDYFWADSMTGEEHVFEVYDRNQMLTFMPFVLWDEPIKEAQEFVYSLRKATKSKRRDTKVLQEVKLDGNLEHIRKEVKSVLIQHDLSPEPIHEGFRSRTLTSIGAKLYMAGRSEEQLWEFLIKANTTLCYNKEGELEGLDEDELKEVLEENLKLNPKVSPQEVREKIEEVRHFLLHIWPYMKGPYVTDWKVLISLIDHGMKYGKMKGENIRIDCSWGTLMGLAKIASKQTFSNKIKRLNEGGILETGNDLVDRSGHFIVHVRNLLSNGYWKLPEGVTEEYVQSYQGDMNTAVYNTIIKNKNHYIGTISHTSWQRQFGSVKDSVIAAIVSLEGRARTSEIALKMGRVEENGNPKSSSISGPLRELVDIGILENPSRGVYELVEDFEEYLYNARSESGEFGRDEKFNSELKKQRRKYREGKEFYRQDKEKQEQEEFQEYSKYSKETGEEAEHFLRW